jgi:hypothetical protein
LATGGLRTPAIDLRPCGADRVPPGLERVEAQLTCAPVGRTWVCCMSGVNLGCLPRGQMLRCNLFIAGKLGKGGREAWGLRRGEGAIGRKIRGWLGLRCPAIVISFTDSAFRHGAGRGKKPAVETKKSQQSRPHL